MPEAKIKWRPTIVVDCETVGGDLLNPRTGARVCMASTCDEELQTRIYYLPEQLAEVCRVLADPRTDKCYHNSRLDLRMLAASGVSKIGGSTHDTLIILRLLSGERRVGLKYAAAKYFGDSIPESEMAKGMFKRKKKIKDETGEEMPPGVMALPKTERETYALFDVTETMKLFYYLRNGIRGKLVAVYQNELALIPIVHKMEDRGVKINLTTLDAFLAGSRSVCSRQKRTLLETAGIEKPGSPQHISNVIKTRFKPPVVRLSPKTGQVKTDESSLRDMGLEWSDDLLMWRRHQKLVSTYYTAIKERAVDGILYADFLPWTARTGRFSSKHPNLQNIPTAARRVFIPRPDHVFISFDYEQIEMRLAAHYSEEPDMLEAFRVGRDLHRETAQLIFQKEDVSKEERKQGKVVNFASIYGISGAQLAMMLSGIRRTASREAQEYLNAMWEKWSELRALSARLAMTLRAQGFIESVYGRRFYPDKNEESKLVNYLIQGTAADVIKFAMTRLDVLFKAHHAEDRVYWLMQIHDELLFEVHHSIAVEKFASDAAATMAEKKMFLLPLPVSVTLRRNNWAEEGEKIDEKI